jgi:hypothetical protein
VRVFRLDFALEDVFGSQARSLQARSLQADMHVTNSIPLGRQLPLNVASINFFETRKATEYRASHDVFSFSRLHPCLQCCMTSPAWQQSSWLASVLIRRLHPCLQCLDGVYGGNGKRPWIPEKNALGHTPARCRCLCSSSEQAWEPMASSSVNFCRKTRTTQRHRDVHYIVAKLVKKVL